MSVKISEISKFVSMALSAHNIDESHVTGVRWGWRGVGLEECVTIDLNVTAPVKCLPGAKPMPFTSAGQAFIAYDAPSLIAGVQLSCYEPATMLPVEHTEESAKTTSGVTP